MVFKCHNKGDDSSGTFSKTQTSKFISKPRLGNSQYTSNSSTGGLEPTKLNEHDVQEEFSRLYTQLEMLKEKNMRTGNRHLASKISAMQYAATTYEMEFSDPPKNKDKIKNSAIGTVSDKLACATLAPPQDGDEKASGVKGSKRQSVSFAQSTDLGSDEEDGKDITKSTKVRFIHTYILRKKENVCQL